MSYVAHSHIIKREYELLKQGTPSASKKKEIRHYYVKSKKKLCEALGIEHEPCVQRSHQ